MLEFFSFSLILLSVPRKRTQKLNKLRMKYQSYPLGAQMTCTLREESNQTNVILQYKLLAAILSAVCCVIQQS